MTSATYQQGAGEAAFDEDASGESVDRWSDWIDEHNGGSRGGGDDGSRLASILGLFSIGLGLTQILTPRGVARAIGMEDDDRNRRMMRAFGMRELASGIGLLTRPRPTGFAWARVAGDAMDLVALGGAYASGRSDHRRVAAATAAVLGVTALDVVAARTLSRQPAGERSRAARSRGIRVIKAITVNRTPEEAYRFWRNFEQLPRFMAHLESVRMMDDRRSYWKARAPFGTTVEWSAELIEDRPNELIAWRSLHDSDVPNAGRVRFTPAPGGRGTEVRVELSYDPPGGVVGATFAKLFGEEPSQQVDGDLRRFKQVLELGEVVHSDASVHRGPHAARPSDEPVPEPIGGGVA
jgi:uncharacterized membrane protein